MIPICVLCDKLRHPAYNISKSISGVDVGIVRFILLQQYNVKYNTNRLTYDSKDSKYSIVCNPVCFEFNRW